MSQLLINRHLSQLAALKKVSGTARETVVREAFKDLLKSWGRSQDLVFVPEYEVRSSRNERRYVDGTLLHALRVGILQFAHYNFARSPGPARHSGHGGRGEQYAMVA